MPGVPCTNRLLRLPTGRGHAVNGLRFVVYLDSTVRPIGSTTRAADLVDGNCPKTRPRSILAPTEKKREALPIPAFRWPKGVVKRKLYRHPKAMLRTLLAHVAGQAQLIGRTELRT